MRQIRKYQKDKGRILDSNKLLYHSLPIGCILALLLLGVICAAPVSSSSGVYAVVDGAVAQSDGKANISIIIDGGDEVDSRVPVITGKTAYSDHTVTVAAEDVESYLLKVTAVDGGSNNLKLEGGTAEVSGASGQFGEELMMDTWGFAWGDTTAADSSLQYYALPEFGTDSTTINNGLLEAGQASSDGTVNFTKKIVFAAKLSGNLPAGHYRASALLSLVVTPKWVMKNLTDIDTMQELTGEVCFASAQGDTKRLSDTRDNEKYWVTKLRDNNCWMVQNLDYNGSGTRVTNVSGWGSEYDVARYYDPGKYVNLDPKSPNDCQNTSSGLPACSSYGWKEVASMTASDDPNFGIDIADNQYNAHYLSGNYYNFQSATDGTGASAPINSQVSGSICPDGWQLPSVAQYQTLISGLSFDQILAAPYYFMYTGAMDGSKKFYGGLLGSYWSSSTSQYTFAAYSLYFNKNGASSLSASYESTKYQGQPIRCLVQQLQP